MKAAVDVPVIAVGRVLPELAEEMVAGGDCDFVAMGRQLLTDPDIVDKLRTGRRDEIRPCINCYVCVEQNFFDDSPRCAVNPALGDESAAEMTPAATARHVVVIGAGPAGLETARLARRRGHRVTLLEATDQLGGTAWFSQLTTPANGPFVDWLAYEVARLGVDVRTGVRADADGVRALAPDVIVVATGATRGRPSIPGADLGHVMTGDELRGLVTGESERVPSRAVRAALAVGRRLGVLRDADRIRTLSRAWLPVGDPVVVVGGGLVGLELAEFLAERRRDVTVLESGPALGLPMASPRRWTAVRRAEQTGVTLVRQADVTEITLTDVAYRTDGAELRVPAESVIIATDVEPGSGLATELSTGLADLGVELHVVGDAADVGYIEGAVRSAWQVAAQL